MENRIVELAVDHPRDLFFLFFLFFFFFTPKPYVSHYPWLSRQLIFMGRRNREVSQR